ncbi:hypothetical protein NHJ6243_002495 [Beauveria neobassiana]
MQRIAIESIGVIAGAKWERLEADVPRLTPREASAGYLDIEHRDGDGRRHPKWSIKTESSDLLAMTVQYSLVLVGKYSSEYF